METLEAIKSRFSARSFLDKDIPKEKLWEIIRAAIRAPNAGNLQSFRFVIVTEDNVKEKLGKSSYNQQWIAQAPVIIAVCSDSSDLSKYYKEKAIAYGMQDCSAAAENILLAATSLGIQSCWVAAFNEGEVSMALRLPQFVTPHVLIPLGYSKETQSSTRHHPEFLVHFNEYGSQEVKPGFFPLFKTGRPLKKKTKRISNKIKEKLKRKK